MSKKIATVRLPVEMIEEFLRDENIDKILKEAADDHTCPMCSNPWPKASKTEKARASFRVEEDVWNSLDKKESYAKYLAIKLPLKYGICPICLQKMRKEK